MESKGKHPRIPGGTPNTLSFEVETAIPEQLGAQMIRSLRKNLHQHMGVSIVMGVPPNGGFIRENPI